MWAEMKPGIPVDDLNYILTQTKEQWGALKNKRLFITGGTGFFGCWLVESFLWANQKLNLQANAVVLTRDVSKFKKKCPHLFAEPALSFIEGDIRDYQFPSGSFAYMVHAATEAGSALNVESPAVMLNTIVQGTTHTLEFAKKMGVEGFLYVSSGAVYGKQPANLLQVAEDYQPNSNRQAHYASAYGAGKWQAEQLCKDYGKQWQLPIKIARCFAFVGPYLPLDSHFAVGNFIKDGLEQRPIAVKGDGSALRSYLYAADLTIWLWTILFQGQTLRPYNVGSDEAISIAALAELVANHFSPPIPVVIEKSHGEEPAERYIPHIGRCQQELGVAPRVQLQEALFKTISWYQQNGNIK